MSELDSLKQIGRQQLPNGHNNIKCGHLRDNQRQTTQLVNINEDMINDREWHSSINLFVLRLLPPLSSVQSWTLCPADDNKSIWPVTSLICLHVPWVYSPLCQTAVLWESRTTNLEPFNVEVQWAPLNFNSPPGGESLKVSREFSHMSSK